jgi:hypothetical protein
MSRVLGNGFWSVASRAGHDPRTRGVVDPFD